MTRTQLDSNLKQAVSCGTPVEVFDPTTSELYYLVSAEQFEKMTSRATGFDPREGYPLVDDIMAADDAHDPLLDSYQ